MKNLMLGTAIAALMAGAASAQDLFRTEMDPVAITASDFIGKRVYAAEAVIDADEYAGVQEGWNDIGEINDIVLSRDGQVDAVLVDIGGFLGMGERQIALGMENIRFVSDSATADELSDYFLVINADRTILEGAPEYMRTGAMPMTEPMADTATDTTTAATAPATAMMVDGYTAVEPASVLSADLVGVRVYGPNDEDVGEIAEVVPDNAGATAQVIVDVGGFLGMGEKPVAIDAASLQFMRANDGDALRVYVNLTQEQLESLPAVTN